MEDDSPMPEGRSDEQDDGDSVAGNGAPKKASKSSAANELEMRQLFHSNKNRTLPDVARELHGNERGPQSERTRQVFAMLWFVIVSTSNEIGLLLILLGLTKSATKEKVLYQGVVYMRITSQGVQQSV